MSSREAWQALRASVPGCCPRTPLSTPPLHQGGGRSARKAPPPLRQRAKRVQGEAARGRGKGKPAQVTGGGDGLGRGPLHDRKDGAPPIPAPVRTDLGLGGKRCEGAREGPLLQVRESAPLPPTSGGRVTLRKLLSRTGGRTCRPRPRAKNLEKEKSCQASGPASPATRPARPLPAGGGPGRCCPSPSPAPTLPPARPRALSPRALRRDPSSSFSHSPSRAAPPLPPDPASGHSSHTPLQDPHSVSLTHSATTAPGRPTYYASLACYVPRARARPDLARGSLAGGGRRTPARAEEYGRAPEPPGR